MDGRVVVWASRRGPATPWGGLQPLLVGMSGQPQLLHACFYTQSRIFRNFSACLVFPKLVFCSAKDRLMGVCAVGAQATTNACSSCLKPPASLYKHSELLFYATIHISSDFGHVSNSSHSAVAAALLCSWRCTGRLRSRSGFQKQLLALWCLHVGSLLHTDVAQPPRSQMTPLAWCPTVDSEQSSRVTDSRARCTDIDITAVKNQFSCV